MANEVIYFAVGVTEEGYREPLGFYVGGQESALCWQDMPQALYQRISKWLRRLFISVQNSNDAWSERKLIGLTSAYSDLQDIFVERYGY